MNPLSRTPNNTPSSQPQPSSLSAEKTAHTGAGAPPVSVAPQSPPPIGIKIAPTLVPLWNNVDESLIWYVSPEKIEEIKFDSTRNELCVEIRHPVRSSYLCSKYLLTPLLEFLKTINTQDGQEIDFEDCKLINVPFPKEMEYLSEYLSKSELRLKHKFLLAYLERMHLLAHTPLQERMYLSDIKFSSDEMELLQKILSSPTIQRQMQEMTNSKKEKNGFNVCLTCFKNSKTACLFRFFRKYKGDTIQQFIQHKGYGNILNQEKNKIEAIFRMYTGNKADERAFLYMLAAEKVFLNMSPEKHQVQDPLKTCVMSGIYSDSQYQAYKSQLRTMAPPWMQEALDKIFRCQGLDKALAINCHLERIVPGILSRIQGASFDKPNDSLSAKQAYQSKALELKVDQHQLSVDIQGILNIREGYDALVVKIEKAIDDRVRKPLQIKGNDVKALQAMVHGLKASAELLKDSIGALLDDKLSNLLKVYDQNQLIIQIHAITEKVLDPEETIAGIISEINTIGDTDAMKEQFKKLVLEHLETRKSVSIPLTDHDVAYLNSCIAFKHFSDFSGSSKDGHPIFSPEERQTLRAKLYELIVNDEAIADHLKDLLREGAGMSKEQLVEPVDGPSATAGQGKVSEDLIAITRDHKYDHGKRLAWAYIAMDKRFAPGAKITSADIAYIRSIIDELQNRPIPKSNIEGLYDRLRELENHAKKQLVAPPSMQPAAPLPQLASSSVDRKTRAIGDADSIKTLQIHTITEKVLDPEETIAGIISEINTIGDMHAMKEQFKKLVLEHLETRKSVSIPLTDHDVAYLNSFIAFKHFSDFSGSSREGHPIFSPEERQTLRAKLYELVVNDEAIADHLKDILREGAGISKEQLSSFIAPSVGSSVGLSVDPEILAIQWADSSKKFQQLGRFLVDRTKSDSPLSPEELKRVNDILNDLQNQDLTASTSYLRGKLDALQQLKKPAMPVAP